MLDRGFRGHFCYYVFITYKLDHLLRALMTFHVGKSHTLEVILILFTHINTPESFHLVPWQPESLFKPIRLCPQRSAWYTVKSSASWTKKCERLLPVSEDISPCCSLVWRDLCPSISVQRLRIRKGREDCSHHRILLAVGSMSPHWACGPHESCSRCKLSQGNERACFAKSSLRPQICLHSGRFTCQ